MSKALRSIIEEHWRRLEAEAVSARNVLRVSDLPVDTAFGPVIAGVDFEGHRHVLIPLEAHQKVRKGLEGPVLHLRRRPLETPTSYQGYADLGCLQRGFDDIFTTLCADVLHAAEASRDAPVKGLYRVIDRWKALFQNKIVLGPQRLAGLFGELLVLIRLLESDRGAYRLWKGPSGHRHDFSSDLIAVEVKTSTQGDGRRPRIHGLDQLDAPAGGSLRLVWFRLEPTTHQGRALQDLVEQALALADDETAVLEALVEYGYRMIDVESYRTFRFTVTEERWYSVDEEFPRLSEADLIAAGVTIEVQNVEYTVDITAEPPLPVEEDEVDRHLQAMIEVPA